MSQKSVKLSEIQSKPIPRYSTGFDELDFIYSFSRFPGGYKWGMPLSKISLWSGTSGIGKSRLAIEVAKKFSTDRKILYFQTESTLEDFAGWAKDTSSYDNFYCNSENKIENMIKEIKEVKPALVIIDSVNEIDEFTNGSKKQATRLINGTQDDAGNVVKEGLRQAANEVGCHIILLGQLNEDGTIKGGTSLPHLVDIALDITPFTKESKSTFCVTIGVKHRYGRRDSKICGTWYHEEDGVRCASDNRRFDEFWQESHNSSIELTEESISDMISSIDLEELKRQDKNLFNSFPKNSIPTFPEGFILNKKKTIFQRIMGK